MPNSSTLSALPPEVLKLILEKLPLYQQKYAATVCKTWYSTLKTLNMSKSFTAAIHTCDAVGSLLLLTQDMSRLTLANTLEIAASNFELIKRIMANELLKNELTSANQIIIKNRNPDLPIGLREKLIFCAVQRPILLNYLLDNYHDILMGKAKDASFTFEVRHKSPSLEAQNCEALLKTFAAADSTLELKRDVLSKIAFDENLLKQIIANEEHLEYFNSDDIVFIGEHNLTAAKMVYQKFGVEVGIALAKKYQEIALNIWTNESIRTTLTTDQLFILANHRALIEKIYADPLLWTKLSQEQKVQCGLKVLNVALELLKDPVLPNADQWSLTMAHSAIALQKMDQIMLSEDELIKLGCKHLDVAKRIISDPKFKSFRTAKLLSAVGATFYEIAEKILNDKDLCNIIYQEENRSYRSTKNKAAYQSRYIVALADSFACLEKILFTPKLKKFLSKQQRENAQRCYKVMLEIKSIAEILRATVMPKTMLLAYTTSGNPPLAIETNKTEDTFNLRK